MESAPAGALSSYLGRGTTTRRAFDHVVLQGLCGVQSSPITVPETLTQ